MKIRNPQTTYNAKKYLPSTLFTNTSAVVSSKMGFEKPKQNRLKRNDSLVRREAQYNKKNNTLRKAYWTRLLHKQRAQWLVKFGGPGSAPIELHDRSRRSWQPAHTQLSVTRSRPNNFVLFRQAAHNALRTVRSQLNPVNSIRADVACAMQPALLQFAPFIRSNQALVFCRLTAGEQQSSLIFAKKSRELAYFRSAQLRVKAKRIVSGQWNGRISVRLSSSMLRFRRDFNAKAGRQLVSRLQANLALRPAVLLKKSHASQLYTRYRRVTERSRNSFVFSASSRMRMLSRASVGDSRAQLRASSTFRRSFLRRSVLKQLACRAHVLYFAAQRYLKNRSHSYFRFVRMLTVVRRRRYRVIPLWRIIRKRKWRRRKNKALASRKKWKRRKYIKALRRLNHRAWLARRLAKPLRFVPCGFKRRYRRRWAEQRRNVRFAWGRAAWQKKRELLLSLYSKPAKVAKNPKRAKLRAMGKTILTDCIAQRYKTTLHIKRRQQSCRALLAAHTRRSLVWLPRYRSYQRSYFRIITRPIRVLRSVRRRNILRSRGLLSQSTALFRVRLSAIVRLIAARQACREVSPAYKQGSTLQITPTLLPLFDKAAAAEHSFLDPIAKTVMRVLPRKSASRTATNKLSPTTPKQSLTKFKLSTAK